MGVQLRSKSNPGRFPALPGTRQSPLVKLVRCQTVGDGRVRSLASRSINPFVAQGDANCR
jgi:hypothetical protein